MGKINYKDTLFEQGNLTTIRDKSTSEMLHKLWNEIKANAKAVYSNLGGRAHGHLGLALTEAQYALIYPTPLVYLTHPGPLIITDGTTAHAKSNMRIVHTEEVRLFSEVTGVEQALVKHIVVTVKEAYITDICNSTTAPINNTMEGVITHLQDKYGQLMPHKLLEREDIVKKTIYKPYDPIATMLSVVEELLDFADTTGTSYTQLQAVNIAYVILHSRGKFGLAICEWNCIPAIQITRVRF